MYGSSTLINVAEILCEGSKSLFTIIIEAFVLYTQGIYFLFPKKVIELFVDSSILSKEVYLNRTYRILKDNSNEVINSLTVVDIEFIDHTDGSKLCRIWGKVDNSKHLSYLLARDCIPN